MERLIRNPILPGFYPDPSVCRVGGDFYLACSSFELYPGIPVFHSRDLAHWEQVSYAMTMENGFHVSANMGTGGVMAPTIRCHDGTFYIINCNFADKGNFYVTASDPKGPWSEPHWITDIPDIDCSLFFDDNGRSYLVSPGDDPSEDNHRAIFLTEYDLKHGKAVGKRTKIWNSALRGAASPEAPHIYHIGDWYYLMIAEGGTEHYHAVTVARSKTVDGWYEGNPANPVMTHRQFGFGYPLDNVGHADFVDTPEGNWYAVLLGSRTVGEQHKNLGRESYICPVLWERGWPVFSPGSGKIDWTYPADPALPWTEYPEAPEKDDFDSQELDLSWSFWGTPYQDFWSIENSELKLKCLPRPLARKLEGFHPGEQEINRADCVSLLCRRQTDISFEVTAKMRFTPENKEAAGLVIMQAANHQFRLEKLRAESGQALRLVQVTTEQCGLPFLPGYTAETTEAVLEQRPVEGDEIVLRLDVDGQDYSFYYGDSEERMQPLFLHADGTRINPEEVGGMIGTTVGMFATANGGNSGNAAAFDWFRYHPKDK
ncbi:MAG: glycoside hydrolase family 43 protein [Oscillospiraceae bacterium]|nr:glycoside hydrolase family 43 protein [Oscillospiraceae bacterium]